MVEARGIEPLSESNLERTSPVQFVIYIPSSERENTLSDLVAS